MRKKTFAARRGFTLVEVVISTVLAGIVVFSVGVVLVDGPRGWRVMYDRINSDVVTDGHVATKMFEAVVRKADGENFLVDDNGNWIEVYYYEDEGSVVADRYVRFYEADGELNVEYGKLCPKQTLSVQPVCGNVSDCVFRVAGRSAQMILTLDDGTQANTVVACGVMHN
jgi:prepilin-type N-terminal cleavage/methylation domain-containing protein